MAPSCADRSGARVAGAAGLAAIAVAVNARGLIFVLHGNVLFGIGIAPNATIIADLPVGAAPQERSGPAAALSETASEFGSALGIAVRAVRCRRDVPEFQGARIARRPSCKGHARQPGMSRAGCKLACVRGAPVHRRRPGSVHSACPDEAAGAGASITTGARAGRCICGAAVWRGRALSVRNLKAFTNISDTLYYGLEDPA